MRGGNFQIAYITIHRDSFDWICQVNQIGLDFLSKDNSDLHFTIILGLSDKKE